jgi:histidinol-phosphate aminotransferase
MQTNDVLSRRAFGRLIGAGAALAALPAVAKPAVAQRLIRLSANENPYGPSPAAIRAMTDAIQRAARYPDALLESLPVTIAASHGVQPANILLGNGSSEILKLAQLAFVRQSLTMADPAFEAIGMYAEAEGRKVVKVPLTADHAHDLERMSGTDLVYICNPNNPTGTITPKARLRDFIASVPRTTVVLVDEAYHHYAESAEYESVIPLVLQHPNLIVARTFSKIHALAGLRCGYAVADAATVDAMQKHQQWDAMNVFAMVAAGASLGDHEHITAGIARNRETRNFVVSRLKQAGFESLPSDANFVMVNLRRPARPLLTAMTNAGVRVGRFFPAMPEAMRVTIGTREEMERFVSAFGQVVKQG